MICPRCKGTTLKVYELAIVGVTYDTSDPDNIEVTDSDDAGDSEAEDYSRARCLTYPCDWDGTYLEACQADDRTTEPAPVRPA